MIKNLSDKDKLALYILIVAAVVIFLFAFVVHPWQQSWRQVEAELQAQEQKLQELGLNPSPAVIARKTRIEKTVPVFDMPQPEDQQPLVA